MKKLIAIAFIGTLVFTGSVSARGNSHNRRRAGVTKSFKARPHKKVAVKQHNFRKHKRFTKNNRKHTYFTKNHRKHYRAKPVVVARSKPVFLRPTPIMVRPAPRLFSFAFFPHFFMSF